MENNFEYTSKIVNTIRKRKEEKLYVFTDKQYEVLNTLLSEENKAKNNKLNIANQYLVLLQIYEATEVNNEVIYYSKLAKRCEKFGLEPEYVSPIIDMLYDNVFINMDWKSVGGVYSYNLKVDEGLLPFTKILYKWCFIENERKREALGKSMGFYTISRMYEIDEKRERKEQCRSML